MILTCGDALFDVFATAGGSASSIALDARVGGSPLNVAVALSRLGQSAAFLAKVSNDPFGRKLIAYLESERVDVDLIVRTPAPTTLAIVPLVNRAGRPNPSIPTAPSAAPSAGRSRRPSPPWGRRSAPSW